jgi:F0F1-type ATP synthase assembly protein I
MVREPEAPNSPDEGPEDHARESRDRAGTTRQNATAQPDEGLSATLLLLGRLTGIGWFVAACIALGAGGGYWADGQFGTRPWLTVAGALAGTAAAFTGMIRLLTSLNRNSRKP